jgi:hypothetical protein
MLQYENPELDAETRAQSRYQVIVKDSKLTPEGLEVTTSVATLQGSRDFFYLCLQDGGIYDIAADRDRHSVRLPPGFPYKTTSWQAAGVNYRVVGRAAVDIPSAKPPNPIGVWVEAVPATSSLHALDSETKRILILPGIGEAETRVLRQGAWETTNRLAALGFTDVY